MALADLKVRGKEYELYPMGAHLAQMMDADFQPADRYPDPQYRFKLDLPDVQTDNGLPATIYYYTPTEATIKNKLGRMLLAFGLPVPKPGQELDLAPLEGRFCQVVITHSMSKDGSGSVVQKVTEILPITPQQKRELQRQRVLPADDPEPAAAPPSQAAIQAQVTAGEDAKAAAVAEARPILSALLEVLQENGRKLNKDIAGPGLLALGKSAKAQECPIHEIDFALVSLENIKLATAEAMGIIRNLGAEVATADDDGDPFGNE